MRAERLFRVLGLVDPALVEEALETRRRASWRRWAALAACLALVLSLGWMATGGFRGYKSGMSGGSPSSAPTGDSGGAPADSAPASPGATGESGGVENGITFMSYAGPVLPLTTLEDAALTAERTVTWDFAPGTNSHGERRQWGARVTDAYVLTNPTEEDVTVTALYPFAGSFSELAEIMPAVTVDGKAAETVLYAGPYSGGFQSAFGAEEPDTMNLEALNSWRAYKALLEGGEYLEQALGDYPALDTPVTVYEFSDFAAPHDKYQAATQAVSFSIDEAATRVLTYGFNGGEWGEGFRRYSYFVPDGKRHEPDLKLLVVLGEDIGPCDLQGYRDGGCDAGEEIEGVSCTVRRAETTMDAVLDRLCTYCRERCAGDRAADRDSAFDAVPLEMYRGAVAELLCQYGALSAAPMDRYQDGRLDDMLAETLHHERVLYLSFPVTAPAGGSAAVVCAAWKEPSYDFGCSGSGNEDLQGYDLTTRLGSALAFTRQSAALVNAENVEITGQDFGFAPEDGALSVELDLEREHFYLEIRPIEE